MGASSEAPLHPVQEPIQPGERPLLVVIVGPTAVGKTSTAIAIAKALQCEIINADSRQVYTGMSIGTAQPTDSERAAVPHHFVNFIEPDRLYSAGEFESDALAWLHQWFKHRRCAVLVGGSGLYIKAVLEGLDPVPADLKIRTHLNQRLSNEGLAPLVQELTALDPKHAARMDTQNPQRVIRALEVCLASGKPFSSFHNQSPQPRSFDTFVLGLEMSRHALIERINKRVDQMMEQGLEKEVIALKPHWESNALQTVGYREWSAYFSGKATKQEVADEIKLHTRQFAKRQMTWFQKMNGIHWFQATDRPALYLALHEQCVRRGWALGFNEMAGHHDE